MPLRNLLGLCLLLVLAFLLAGCSEKEIHSVEYRYEEAMLAMDQGLSSKATPILEKITEENPGTRYATYAYLKLGDAYLDAGATKENFNKAETNYRIFLSLNPTSHLVPYVLSRLIELNYKKNVSTLFNDEYAFSRDPEHFAKIITEYQRFYLLYPNSLYLADSTPFLDKSIEALAEHELIIGRWYMGQSLYPSAITRFTHLLDQYPNFPKRQVVLQELILAYRANQQPKLADELSQSLEKGIN